MKNLLWIIMFIACGIQMDAQSFCYTPSNTSNYLASLSLSQLAALAPSYRVRVVAHIVRTSAGTGGMTPIELTTAMNVLNQDYGIHNICFQLISTVYINNDTYYNGGFNTSIYNVGPVANAIDIYFFPNSCPNAGGRAQGIGAKALYIGGTWNNLGTNVKVNTSHILSHEMGHCLGLYHTHHGTFDELTPGECAELVNGSNCDVCGDFVCDTPADPHVQFDVNTNCTWLGSGSDAQGNAYNPNTHLIMAYTQPLCMQTLTAGQAQRMYAHLSFNPILQPVVAPGGCCPNAITITGYYGAALTQSASWIKSVGQTTIQGGSSIILDANPYAGYVLLAPTSSSDFLLSAPSANGKFVAQILDGCGPGLPSIVAPSGGIAEATKDNQTIDSESLVGGNEFLIYPNPTHGWITVEHSQTTKSLQVFDVLGNLIQSAVADGGHNTRLNLSEFPMGVYFVRVDDGRRYRLVKL